jgi:hypothetical protein
MARVLNRISIRIEHLRNHGPFSGERSAEETAVVSLDGVVLEGAGIPLLDDGRDYEVVIRPRE